MSHLASLASLGGPGLTLLLETCEVVVAYDSEDKTGKPLTQRHDALIWARYLAGSLQYTAGVSAQVCLLPADWRVQGKADWDGDLAHYLETHRI